MPRCVVNSGAGLLLPHVVEIVGPAALAAVQEALAAGVENIAAAVLANETAAAQRRDLCFTIRGEPVIETSTSDWDSAQRV